MSDVMHGDTASSCIPAAITLWNSGQAIAFLIHILCYRSCIIHFVA